MQSHESLQKPPKEKEMKSETENHNYEGVDFSDAPAVLSDEPFALAGEATFASG